MVPSIYDPAAVSYVQCWVMRGAREGLFRRRLLRCRGHRGGTLLLYMLGRFWPQNHEARESTRGSSREDRAASIRWLSSARRAI